MTDEQINAAIAKELGWTQVEAIHRSGRAPSATYVGREFIPNYCTDLNAMHEALMTLKDYSVRKYYTQMLEAVVDEPLRFYAIASTARQRAEAFLRTLGKWEEVQG